MLFRKREDCFGFGCAFAYLANAVGYRAYAVSSGGHGWAEVDGRVYDPDWAKVTGKVNLYCGMNYNVTGPGIPYYKGNRCRAVSVQVSDSVLSEMHNRCRGKS